MPYTKDRYPDSMKNLPIHVRNKAIDITNALLKEGKMDDGIAIATGISRAKDWATNRGLRTASTSNTSRSKDVKAHGEDRYVIPAEDGWAVKEEGSKRVERKFATKKESVALATKEAKKAHASVTVQRKTGEIERRKSFTPHRNVKSH
jgi:uncharacterized protein YdaT